MTQKQKQKWIKQSRLAFTLVELMVVIVIIGLLASIVAVNVVPFITKAKVKAAQTQIKTLHKAVKFYKIDTGQYPDSLEDLVEQPPGVTGWNKDGYLDGVADIPLDPWNYPYEYDYPGEYGVYDIFSLGADGKEGGEDEEADLYNSDVITGGTDEDENL